VTRHAPHQTKSPCWRHGLSEEFACDRAGVILIDAAQEFVVFSGKGKQRSAERHFDTQSLDEIKALPVGALAAKDCAVFCWVTNPWLDWREIFAAWGLEYVTVAFVWIKLNRNSKGVLTEDISSDTKLFMGMGYHTHANFELCLLARRGRPRRLSKSVHNVILAPVGEHSAKPAESYRRIEQLYPGPCLELFARRPREGWTTWGNELPDVRH
jgi:N6-adenosine-specific RNA methylase IME4